MTTEGRRAAMLAAMGIDVYRLRNTAARDVPLRIGVDAQACVCVDEVADEAAERLLALLPAVLGIGRERVRRQGVADDGAIQIDASAVRGDGAAKRALWQALKPLARHLRESD